MAIAKGKKPEKKDENKQDKKTVKTLRARPFGDRILVKPEASEEKTAGGIIIPDTVKQEKPEKGRVVAVGEGKQNEDGKIVPMRIKVGDKVMFNKYGYDEIKIDGDEYFIVSESNVIAIL